MAEKKPKSPPLIEVTVIAENHTHEGKPVKKGNKIRVTAEQRTWLANNKIIEVNDV